MANPPVANQTFGIAVEQTVDTDDEGRPLPDAEYATRYQVAGEGQEALDLCTQFYYQMSDSMAQGAVPNVRRIGVVYTEPVSWHEWDVPPNPAPWQPIDNDGDGVPDDGAQIETG